MQCGVACLQMICRYYKKIYSTDTLHQYCFATNEGVSLLGISDAAKKLGLRTVWTYYCESVECLITPLHPPLEPEPFRGII